MEEQEFYEPDWALVYFNHEKHNYIWVYLQDDIEPHFLVIDDEAQHTTKKIGISLYEPKYVKLPLEREEQEWILSEVEKNELVQILKKQDRLHCKKRKIWQSVLHFYNWELNKKVVQEDLQMPNYMDLPEK